jgi:hypothetical protein
MHDLPLFGASQGDDCFGTVPNRHLGACLDKKEATTPEGKVTVSLMTYLHERN